ncbi:MAG: hypothetical protein V4598_08480 [Bdellovibrionota bacterium]
MSEILKAAYDKPNALTQSKNYSLINRGEIPKYYWDLYPLAQDYFHEFNPYLVHTIYKPAVFPAFNIFTVRDGMHPFADFLVLNLKDLHKWKTRFLIPESYTPLIPDSLSDKFLAYSLTQVNKPDIKKAKTVVVFGLLNEYYYGSYEAIEKRLAPLKDLAPDVKIEVCLTQRRTPLLMEEKENLHYIHIPEIVRKVLGNREFKWLRLRELMEKTVLRDHYLIDLIHTPTLICDSYLHHWFLSRGGMINSLAQWKKEDDSIFEIDLSFNQKLNVKPLPDVKREISELVFFYKTHKGEMWNSPPFHQEVSKIVKWTYPLP